MTLTFRICWGLGRVHFHIKEHSSNVECTFSAVPIQKPTGPNLILQYHKSRSTKGYNLCKLCNTAIQDDTYHVSRQSTKKFGRRRFLPYGGRLGHVIWTQCMNFLFPLRRSPLKILTNSRHARNRWLRSLNDLSL